MLPFACVLAGSSSCERLCASSASAFGSSCASTIATVRPPPLSPDTLYADWRSAGSSPVGLVTESGASFPLLARWARIRPKQCSRPAPVAEAQPKPTLSLGALTAAPAEGTEVREKIIVMRAARTIADLWRGFNPASCKDWISRDTVGWGLPRHGHIATNHPDNDAPRNCCLEGAVNASGRNRKVG